MYSTLQTILRSCAAIVRGVNLVADRLASVEAKQEKIMAELDDLKANMATLVTSVAGGNAEMSALANKILALLGAPGGVDPAAVEAVAVEMKEQSDAIDAAVAAAKSATGV